MKRILVTAAALALMSGAAFAEDPSKNNAADPTDAQRAGKIAQPSGEGSNAGKVNAATTNSQPADATDAQRAGKVAQPSGEGANAGKMNAATDAQPSDPEQSQRKGKIAEPTGAGGTAKQ